MQNHLWILLELLNNSLRLLGLPVNDSEFVVGRMGEKLRTGHEDQLGVIGVEGWLDGQKIGRQGCCLAEIVVGEMNQRGWVVQAVVQTCGNEG